MGIGKWIVLEPLMLLETLTFGAYVTQQNMFKHKIRELFSEETDDELRVITSHFFR